MVRVEIQTYIYLYTQQWQPKGRNDPNVHEQVKTNPNAINEQQTTPPLKRW